MKRCVALYKWKEKRITPAHESTITTLYNDTAQLQVRVNWTNLNQMTYFLMSSGMLKIRIRVFFHLNSPDWFSARYN